MAKHKTTQYLCTECGSSFTKWQGRCPDCGQWNTLVESETSAVKKKSNKQIETIRLDSVEQKHIVRIDSGINELNLVCGGGIVPGSVILIGGEPGIGKSTLSIQIANNINTLYVSGEESPNQLRGRADRLQIDASKIEVSTSIITEEITHLMELKKPTCVIVDSIQTVASENVAGIAGSVSQIRESAAQIASTAKRLGIIAVIIGHITKDGAIAGPKILEHLVDTVLYFEGNSSKDYRILRSFKNRFGSINEVGLFQMTAKGLIDVKNKNNIFLNPFDSMAAGSAISAAVEGTRTILFEVQALANFTNFSNPRRLSDGLDFNRLVIISAILEKHTGLKLNSFDIFINMSGGFKLNERSGDLAVAVAIASSIKNVAISRDTAFLGELSLSGEIRPVAQLERRLQELNLVGIRRLFIANSRKSSKDDDYKFDGEIIPVSTIQDVVNRVF
ncbi:MAG: DNA repair protein RadA [Deltaproteobacteria bacterium]|nr:DNA repair protein RadA [Deltaproteobacteria bacterium]